MANKPAPAVSAAVEEVSVAGRIPEFWRDMPRLWFAQFEAVMEPQKQGDSIKFSLVLAKLSRDIVQQIGDILLKPPEQNKYKVLKDRLIAIYEESAESQFKRLISEMDLGTQRPSQLLRRMLELANNTEVSKEAVKRLWIGRLPNTVKVILTVAKEEDLESLAEMADKIMETTTSSEVAATTDRRTSEVADLTEELKKMCIEMQSMREEIYELRGRNMNRGNAWRRDRSRSRPRRAANNGEWLCRFHFRYGDRATSCEEPCNWSRRGSSRKAVPPRPAEN